MVLLLYYNTFFLLEEFYRTVLSKTDNNSTYVIVNHILYKLYIAL